MPIRSRLVSAWFCLAVLLGGQVFSQEKPLVKPDARIRVDCIRDEGRGVFVIHNLKRPEMASVTIWVAGSDTQSVPSMSGKSKRVGDKLVFSPKYALRPRSGYIVKVKPNEDSPWELISVKAVRVKKRRATLEGIFPSSDRLPENTLRFYLQFSEPMRKGDVYQFVRIRETDCDEVDSPFLEIEQEFWSRDSTRLTLLLDPGRIKRGLKPREEMGPIFVEGHSYELVVSGKWADASGQALGQDVVKRFKILQEDHQQPDPSRWKITVPDAGTRDPLVLAFPEPLDHAMLYRVIQIRDTSDRLVDGEIVVSNHETQWSLTPIGKWRLGTYTISVDRNLEDCAGNSIARPFDVDIFDKTQRSEGLPLAPLSFEVQ